MKRLPRPTRLLFVCLAAFAALLRSGDANELSPEANFQVRVWPVLERSCVRCHGPEKQKSGLRLDSREAALKGGESGPAVVIGKPAESLLIKLVRHVEDDRVMPPKDALEDSEIVALERWISDGAPWPGKEALEPPEAVPGERLGNAWRDPRNPIVSIFGGKRLDLWSFQPIQKASPPAEFTSSTWVRNPIDAFTLANLKASGLQPAQEADRRTLIRRVTFDLTGLPPTPEEVAAFLSETDPHAYEKLVDRLLDSRAYGEHWGRMWLDVVRYSDSNGFDWDEYRLQAWRFRDYVIRSFNADKPFDRFIREQLAGDELLSGAPKTAEEQDCLIATGFLRMGPHDNSAANFGEGPRVRAALMNDLVETTGAAFLGLQLSCCRCHNHKFDPVSQADYYRLRAFFEGVKFADDLPIDLADAEQAKTQHNGRIETQIDAKRRERNAVLDAAKKRIREKRRRELTAEQKALLRTPKGGRSDSVEQAIVELEKKVEPSDDEAKSAFTSTERTSFETADHTVQELKKEIEPMETGLLMIDENANPAETHVLFQGDLTKPRETVLPGPLSAFDPNPSAIEKPARENSSGRRSALAAWLISPENPLTPRVLVNRIWQGHFGEGIQATANDFGFSGSRPSCPELLDWLATEFVRDGWSLKKLHRLILTSATYMQGEVSDAPPHSFRGQKPRRLTAEALRDAMLATAGKLAPQEGGPPIWPELPDEVLKANPAFLDDNAEKTKGWYTSPHEKTAVRSIYLIQKRSVRTPLMEAFDLPENSLSCPRRNVSTVAPQALMLMNGAFAAEMAVEFAKRVEAEAGDDIGTQTERAFMLAFQRSPDFDEKAMCAQFRERRTLAELCRALLNANEFAYFD